MFLPCGVQSANRRFGSSDRRSSTAFFTTPE
jgi:hypothetical protein